MIAQQTICLSSVIEIYYYKSTLNYMALKYCYNIRTSTIQQ